MRLLALALSASIFTACNKKESAPPPPPPPAMAPMAPMASTPINLQSLAGTWKFKVMGAASDSVLTTYTLVVAADTTGWMMTLPNRKPMRMHVMVMGDSVMLSSPQYESVLRKGQQVTLSSVMHVMGDKLMGTTMAHYVTKGPDSLVALRSEGTKAPK
jgi:hypothetical protein